MKCSYDEIGCVWIDDENLECKALSQSQCPVDISNQFEQRSEKMSYVMKVVENIGLCDERVFHWHCPNWDRVMSKIHKYKNDSTITIISIKSTFYNDEDY